MDFGSVPHIDAIDFTFPNEHSGNVNILPGFPSETFSFHLGFPIWSEKSWVGKIYPKGSKEKDFLRLYAEQYNCIELNATHYNIPDESTIERWRNSVPPTFKFCPKIPQQISHAKDIVAMTETMHHFLATINKLESNLGTAFMQLPPTFGPSKIKSLLYFLNALPDGYPLSIELRHPDWFTDRLKFDKLFNYLEDRRLGAIITDVAGRRDVLHVRLANRTAFIRFTANDNHPSDKKRMSDWITLLEKWKQEGIKEIYFIIHSNNAAYCPELAKIFMEIYRPTHPLYNKPTSPQQGNLFG